MNEMNEITDKIILGKIDGETVSITKHKWDCNWYWSFGYLGNYSSHFHIQSLITSETDVNQIFESTWLTQTNWWILRDLFIQAYALKGAAEVYRYGGHQMSIGTITDVIKNWGKADQINTDLEILLNRTWDYIVTAKAKVNYH